MRKRTYIILVVIVMSVLSIVSALFAQWKEVCVDPGHGGPGASKYGPNGDGEGTDGPLPNGKKLSEQWVNLQVAFVLRDSIDNYHYDGSVLMTRTTDTQQVYLQERADTANFANCDWHPIWCASEEFISVHHNGLDLDSQGVETYWCNLDTIRIDGFLYNRDTTKFLAQKVYYKLIDKFVDPPYRPRGCKMEYKYVLRSTTMPSTLSEGTNMHNMAEAILFDDPDGEHVRDEAGAIYLGWKSYHEKSGIAHVENRWIGGNGGIVNIDGVIRNSPYYTCWGHEEEHVLEAQGLTYFDDYLCTFHHWKELETGNYWLNTAISVFVMWWDSTHTFVAYFKGGPYSVKLDFPNSGEYTMGESLYIDWYSGDTDLGIDSTALIDAYLDRNGGGDGYPEKILSDIPVRFFGHWWQITGPASESCKIKLVSQDCVDNYAEDVSDYYISIVAPDIPGDANSDGIVDLADVIYIANYYFGKGPPPEPEWKGDVNGDCHINIGDPVYLAKYLFSGGPAPWCNPDCPDWNCESRLPKTKAIKSLSRADFKL